MLFGDAHLYNHNKKKNNELNAIKVRSSRARLFQASMRDGEAAWHKDSESDAPWFKFQSLVG